MKKNIKGELGKGIVFALIIVIMLGMGSISTLAVSPIEFGCENFEAAVRESDGVPDTGPIYPADVSGITNLSLANRSISSLAGIEHFTGLIHLEAPHNQLTSVDVSSNVLLESLNLFHNQLTSIDVSNNSALRWLHLSYDNQLTSVDVSNNPALEILMVSFLRLTTLDISNNPNLQILRAEQNQLTTLNVSNNPQLYSIWLRWNNMASLDAVVGFAGTSVDVDGVHDWGDPTFQFYPQNVADEDVADDTTHTSDDLVAIRDGAGTANITLPNGRTITISNIGTNLPATINLNVEVDSRANASTAYGAQIPANSIVIDPAATGNFGFTISITISDSELADRNLSANTVNLFHVSTAGAVSNRSNQLTRNSDNSVTVSFDSASVLVLSENAPVAPVGEPDVWYTPGAHIVQAVAPVAHDVPQTGITGRMILPLVLALLGVAVITVGQVHRIRKKKAENK